LGEEEMRSSLNRKHLVWALAALMLMTFTSGCSLLKRRDKSTAGGAEGGAAQAAKDIYLDFDDVLIPDEMPRDSERSFVFRIGALTAGVLVLKGRVPPDDLVTFFENNMARDNWKAASSFRSPRSLLIYEKEERWCIITITEDDFDHKTRVEIWVSPKSEEMATGLVSE
jgi:hypothetical protein